MCAPVCMACGVSLLEVTRARSPCPSFLGHRKDSCMATGRSYLFSALKSKVSGDKGQAMNIKGLGFALPAGAVQPGSSFIIPIYCHSADGSFPSASEEELIAFTQQALCPPIPCHLPGPCHSLPGGRPLAGLSGTQSRVCSTLGLGPIHPPRGFYLPKNLLFKSGFLVQ